MKNGWGQLYLTLTYLYIYVTSFLHVEVTCMCQELVRVGTYVNSVRCEDIQYKVDKIFMG